MPAYHACVNPLIIVALAAACSFAASAAELRIQSFQPSSGVITWSGAYTAGVCNVQTALAPNGPWIPRKNVFTSNEIGGTTLSWPASNTFARLLSVDISTNSPRHFTNLVESYGIL